jgi:hypothetical protein
MTNQQRLIKKLEDMGFDFFDECNDDSWAITVCNGKQSYTINSYMVYQHGSGILKYWLCYESSLQWIVDMETMTA